jgi:hypothetical protein
VAKTRKGKLSVPAVLVVAASVALCVAVEMLGVELLPTDTLVEQLVTVVLVVGGPIAAIAVHLVARQVGRLVGGWLAGYRFSSIRFGPLVWIKLDGKVRLRRYSVAVIDGQCLMAPPQPMDGDFPCALYILGGPLANLVMAAVFGALCLATQGSGWPFHLLLVLAVMGLVTAAISGIPVRFGPAPNDGKSALLLAGRGGEAARRALWISLQRDQAAAAGVRWRDMPAEWFVPVAGARPDDQLNAGTRFAACGRMLDERQFEMARRAISELLADEGVADLHRRLLTLDLVYCELIGENRAEVVSALLDHPVLAVLRAMKGFPSILRVHHALALLRDGDAAAGRRLEEEFERVAAQYPYAGEIAVERELMEHTKAVAASRAAAAGGHPRSQA